MFRSLLQSFIRYIENKRKTVDILQERRKAIFALVFLLIVFTVAYVLSEYLPDYRKSFVLNAFYHRDGGHVYGNLLGFVFLLLVISDFNLRLVTLFIISCILTSINSLVVYFLTGKIGFGLSFSLFFLFSYYSLYLYRESKIRAVILFLTALLILILEKFSNQGHYAPFLAGMLFYGIETGLINLKRKLC